MKTELEKGHILRKSLFNINVFITKDMILCYFQKHYKVKKASFKKYIHRYKMNDVKSHSSG